MRRNQFDLLSESTENFFHNNHLPSIFAFPKDENFWRIDWFGEVAFPNRLLRRTQPSVLVHLSRVLNTSFQENPALLLAPDFTFASRQRKVWISVGTLPADRTSMQVRYTVVLPIAGVRDQYVSHISRLALICLYCGST